MQAQVFNTINQTVVPIAVVLLYILYRYFLERIPEKQSEALHWFVEYAVQQVEQAHSTAESAQKKSLAMGIVQDLFKEHGLPVPALSTISIVIENFILMLHQEQQRQQDRHATEPLVTPPTRIPTVQVDLDTNPLAKNAPNA